MNFVETGTPPNVIAKRWGLKKRLLLTDTKVSAAGTKIELVDSGITEKTWTNAIVIYFSDVFTEIFTIDIKFFWYFFYTQYLSRFIILPLLLFILIFNTAPHDWSISYVSQLWLAWPV